MMSDETIHESTMPSREMIVERLVEYNRISKILRQIDSNKSFKFKRLDERLSVLFIVITALLTFLGFTGIEKIHGLIPAIAPVSLVHLAFAFNSLIFLILLLVILNLVYRFGAKSMGHNRAIVVLTGYIRDLEDMIKLQNFYDAQGVELVDAMRERYKMITETLPPSTDKEFYRSKMDLMFKNTKSKNIENPGT